MKKAGDEKNRFRAFIVVSLLVAGGLVIFGLKVVLNESGQPEQKARPGQPEQKVRAGVKGTDDPTPQVTLDELGQDFMANAEAAEKKYKGKVVTVTGTGWTRYFDFDDVVRMIYRGKTTKTWDIELEFHLPKETIAATQAALKQAERQLRIDYDRQREAFAAGTAPKSPVTSEHAVITMSGICREIEWPTDLPGAKRGTIRFAKGKLVRIVGQLK